MDETKIVGKNVNEIAAEKQRDKVLSDLCSDTKLNRMKIERSTDLYSTLISITDLHHALI